MARTLILNISETGQTLPAIYGGFLVAVGHGRVVSDETSVAVNELGGFAAMDGKWVVYPVSTDTLEGDFDVAANGVAMLATFVPGGGGGGGGPVNWSDILNKPAFSDVATSGSYDDLTDTPTPFSGAYGDLTGTPTIPAASNDVATDVGSVSSAGVQSAFSRADHQHAHGTQAGGSLHAAATTVSAGFMSAADKTKLDGLAVVASSGDYNDLINVPGLSVVAMSGSFTDLADAPTYATVASSGDYADLINKPSLFDGAYSSLTGAPALASVASSGSYNDLTDKPSLADVATSGSFADLTNKPAKTYDLMSSARGALALATTVMECLMPSAVTFSALTQGGGATVKVQVNGADITYPKSVSAGQLVSFVVTVAGTNNYATLAGAED